MSRETVVLDRSLQLASRWTEALCWASPGSVPSLTTREVRSKVKSGATTANGAPHALTANYVYYRDIFETDPDTSAAWTSGGVNALQLGPEVVT